MKLPALITTDLHFTASPRDEYRWALWSWLRKTCEKEGVQTLCILGDLTDAKDYHSAELVNRIVEEVKRTSDVVPRIIILQGNHDYQKGGHPYFRFLSTLAGVTFAHTILDTSDEGEACLFLPHTKTPLRSWGHVDFSHYRWVFMHQTVNGSVASNGQRMDGDQFPDMTAAGKVYSGDIHVPQVISGVEYVGSPYHVHFGDKFTPRCLLLDSFGKPHDLRFRTISRITLDCLPGEFLQPEPNKTLQLRAGDQVKLRIHLQPAELHEWQAYKRRAEEVLRALDVEVHGIELVSPKHSERIRDSRSSNTANNPEELVLGFVQSEGLGGDALDIGLELLE